MPNYLDLEAGCKYSSRKWYVKTLAFLKQEYLLDLCRYGALDGKTPKEASSLVFLGDFGAKSWKATTSSWSWRQGLILHC